jgi:hypothetical protein
MVSQPATRIGVKSPEQHLQRVEEPDDNNSCTERFEVLRRKAEPEPLAAPGQHECHQQEHGIAPQAQEIGKFAPSTHVAIYLAMRRWHSALSTS